MINDKGFSSTPQANPEKNVGSQGATGTGLGGPSVPGAAQPHSGGKVPSSMGSVPADSMLQPQNGVMPPVGK